MSVASYRNGTMPLPELRTLVQRLSPSRAAASHDEWVKIGMAIHSANSSDMGFQLWEEFSRQCPEKYDPVSLRTAWKSFRPGSVGIGTLIHLANQDSPRPASAHSTGNEITYDYTDTAGQLLYQAVRYYRDGKKSFYQRRPDGQGGWITKEAMKGVRRVLYHLPNVMQAVTAGETIFIVEGEKDADTLQRFGLVATTNVGGAGKWNQTDQTPLTGANVVILPDNDVPGQQHAADVAKLLLPIAQAIRIVQLPNLPNKGDVTDWLQAGNTTDALLSLCEEAKPFESAPVLTKQPEATPSTVSTRIRAALTAAGYTFRQNELDAWVEVNNERLTDELEAQIMMDARDRDVRPIEAVRQFIISEAARNRYHPIKDYLNGLVWDGQNHISTLCAYLTSSDPAIEYPNGTASLHSVYLYRWLIGAVAKVLEQAQNLTLVLAGPQDIGKSTLARWLCSGIGYRYFLESRIDPNDKDAHLRAMRSFVWEVPELDATTRKADMSALKAFLTQQEATVRKAYGHYDTTRPVNASFIGTVNKGEGFLSDSTGNRRFLVTTLTAIDHRYTNSVDVNQVWAEAVALYHQGEPWRLQPNEQQAQSNANAEHEFDSPLEGWLSTHFEIDAGPNYALNSAEIIDHLRNYYDIRLSGSDRGQAMEISRACQKLGIERRRPDSRKPFVYLGLRPILPSQKTD